MDIAKYNSDLKRVQVKYDEQIHKIIHSLETHADKKQYDYKECEEVARHAEFDTEVRTDNQKVQALDAANKEKSKFIETLNNENQNLAQLTAILHEVIRRAEEEQSRFRR